MGTEMLFSGWLPVAHTSNRSVQNYVIRVPVVVAGQSGSRDCAAADDGVGAYGRQGELKAARINRPLRDCVAAQQGG